MPTYSLLSTKSSCLSTTSPCILSIVPYLTPAYLLTTIHHICLSIYNLSMYPIHRPLISHTCQSISKTPYFSHRLMYCWGGSLMYCWIDILSFHIDPLHLTPANLYLSHLMSHTYLCTIYHLPRLLVYLLFLYVSYRWIRYILFLRHIMPNGLIPKCEI